MTDKPVAGTFRLDGMLQGPLPAEHQAGADMQAWVESAKANGLHFHLSFDGSNYSLVAAPSVQRVTKLKDQDLEKLLSDGLNALLSLLPESEAANSFSTIRSEEFRPGSALQTLYAVGPGGTISSEQREVDIDTETPPPEITPASLRRSALPIAFVLLLALLISFLFIDYRELFSSARDRLVNLEKDEVTIQQDLLGDYLEIELSGVDNKHDALIFVIKRGPKWEEAISSTPNESASNWPDFATQLAIHQRRLRVELFDKDDKLLLSGELNISPLHKKKSAEVAVIAKFKGRLAKIVVRP